MADLSGRANSLIGAVVAVVVVLGILGATIGLMYTSVADVNNEIATGTTNSTEADAIAPVFPILIGVTFLLAIVGVVTAAVKFRKS